MTARKKILIVDDEEDFLKLIRDSLEIRGIEAITTTSAVEAGLELASSAPDMILMDIKMPGINGLQACEAIKKNPATVNIPIIIVSALSEDSEVKRAHTIGVADYFVKPIDIEKLMDRIKSILKI